MVNWVDQFYNGLTGFETGVFLYNNCVSITINCHVVFNVVVSAITTACIATTTVDIMPTSVITQGIISV